MFRKTTAILLALSLVCLLAACGGKTESTETQTQEGAVMTNLAKIDMTKWQYNADDNVYYQIGIAYCETPADAANETLAVFVPGAYFLGTDNGDGTYTCELATQTVNGFTAETAPIVMPINTPGYFAMAALTDYASGAKDYTDAGFVYVHAGCRGRDAGAPAGVADLKAAVRYLRYTDDVCAGDAERIFTFGMSGGGAQSALMGATGDSDLYTPYLEQIGAVMGVSDAVCGSMDWCPITNLDSADAAYEWMMGSTRSGLSNDEQAISDALAAQFAAYINSAGLRDESGNVLTLEESESGIYQSGSDYADDYAADLQKTDSIGYTAAQRLSMYSPLYYLLASEEGYGTSTVARYWRIRTGIAQSDTALTTEVNLALALESYDGVESVDFETVWAQGHVEAERTGSSTENFVAWVQACLA